MLLIKAIVRPEKSAAIINALGESGYHAVTKFDVSTYSPESGEIRQDMLYVACEDTDKVAVINVIMTLGKTNGGENDDGRIFVSEIEEAYTISTGERGL